MEEGRNERREGGRNKEAVGLMNRFFTCIQGSQQTSEMALYKTHYQDLRQKYLASMEG